ncbi:MAG TPA: NADPH-dependent FMN reductase [Gallionella sp.]|nr:NADPH-dependent FMN reductase [Gallionella sp.]
MNLCEPGKMRRYQILAISGSLRAASLNSTVLRVASSLPLPEGQIRIYQGLADLPHFNPDMEGKEPASVLDLRGQLQQADGVLIACPEYAHGVPGAFKNALDWVVASGEFVNKPVALINLFARSIWAPALLKETLSMMTATVIEPASITLQLPGNKVSEDFIAADARIASAMRSSLAAFVHAIKEHKAAS